MDKFTDLTNYTQAIDDWDTPLWTDFNWGNDGACYSFQDISNLWRGTVAGNVTENNTESIVVQTGADNAQIPPEDPILQPYTYQDSGVVLCGKRGELSFRSLNRTTVELNSFST